MATAPTVPAPDSPLKTADLKLINSALYKLNQSLELLDRAEQAGIDTSDARLARENVLTQLVAIKQTYFPGAQ